MKLARSWFFLALMICFALLLSGCTKSTSESDSDQDSAPEQAQQDTTQILSDCGIIADGIIANPVDSGLGQEVRITGVVNHHAVIVRRDQGDQLIKLRGLKEDIPQYKKNAAITQLNRMRGAAYLFSDGCPYNSASTGQGIVGDLVLVSDNESFIETLLNIGAAEPSPEGVCGEAETFPCHQALAENATPITGATVTNFLWKPVSERDGNLAILLSPARASIFANGESLVDFGPSNGRGTTGRANKPGCAFGANVIVEAFDSQGRPLVFPDGATSYTIANGCSRVEFQ